MLLIVCRQGYSSAPPRVARIAIDWIAALCCDRGRKLGRPFSTWGLFSWPSLAQFGCTAWRGVENRDVQRFYQRFASAFPCAAAVPGGGFALRSMKFRKANNLEIGAGYRVQLR